MRVASGDMAIVSFWLALGCMYVALQWRNNVVEGGKQSQPGCKQFYRYADCSYLQLSYIPQDLPTDTEELILDFNIIENLDEHSLLWYHDLKSLHLKSNSLKRIMPYTFQNTMRLESLSLQDNMIDTNYVMVASSLRSIASLKKLDLSRNELTEDMVTILLRNLTSLEFLSLDNNIIMHLDDSVFEGLSELKELSLQRNYIYEIEEGTFDGLMNLRNLNLAYNNLPCIVDFGLTQVQMLNLSFNSIEWFMSRETNEEFHLKQLDISHNQLLFFPLLPRHNHLNVLLLSDNELRFYANISDDKPSYVNFLIVENNNTNLTTVDLWEEVSFGDLSNVHFLDMSRNQFHYLPEGFLAKMTSLSYLKLNWNCLETFSLSQNDITSALTELDLSNNELSNIQIDNISQNSLGLIYFNLSSNNLQTLPRNIFHTMNRITNLDLSYNKISLCSYTDNVAEVNEKECVDIRNVESLKYLSISKCGMELDEQRVFYGTRITSLELSYNQLKSIHSLLDIADSLQFLYMRNTLSFNVSVDYSAFKSLQGLDLSENFLTTFPISLNELSLHFLNLHKNSLTSLPLYSSYQPILMSLNTLYLSNNPFDCCDLSWWSVLSSNSRIRIPDLQQVTCKFSDSHLLMNSLPESIRHSCQWKTGGPLLYLLLALPVCLTLLVVLLLLFLVFKQTLLQTLKSRCRRSSSY